MQYDVLNFGLMYSQFPVPFWFDWLAGVRSPQAGSNAEIDIA